MNNSLKLLLAAFSCVVLSGCPFLDKSYPSQGLQTYLADHPAAKRVGQARFLLDDLGSLSPKSLLESNIIPIKIYFTALLLAEKSLSADKISVSDIPPVMEQFGFIRPAGIANWNSALAPMPALPEIEGFIHTQFDFEVPLVAQVQLPVKRFRLEVGNITCAACHSGMSYDSNGMPSRQVWLGSPNSSINIDGFFDQIYRGLKIAAADQKKFMRRVRQVYPKIDPLEDQTIEAVLGNLGKELKKFSKMNRVFSYPNGGPGTTNGVGAFKRDAHLVDRYAFNPKEAGIVSIPDLSYRGFRSSLLTDGAYGVPGRPRYEMITAAQAADPNHGVQLANMAAFFSFAAMGNPLNHIEPNLPRVRELYRDFLATVEPPRFPGRINSALAARGQALFAKKCASCHGEYSASLERPKLLKFPNRLVPQDVIGSDRERWASVDDLVVNYAREHAFAKYIDASKAAGGYVAPILSGVWTSAPYLHNGSVPTLWQLMNPAERPARFQVGGHAIDFEQVGIAGVRSPTGDWVYRPGYQPWSRPMLYDTAKLGQSNAGHEGPFRKLTDDDKWALIEYLKLL